MRPRVWACRPISDIEVCKDGRLIRSPYETTNDFHQEFTTRLILGATTCAVTPTLMILAYIQRRRAVRLELPNWRDGVGLTAMFIVFALWLIQTARWAAIEDRGEFTGFLSPSWIEVETLLTAFYAYPALPLALALKGVPRLQVIAAWFFLAVFYRTFWYA